MHSKAFAAALMALTVPAYAAMAQSSGPAKGVSESTSAAGGRVTTQGGETVRPVTGAREFVEQAASSGLLEVEAGRMAVDKANRDSVRAFGQHMVTDHTKANQQLMALASQHGIAPPSTLEPRHQTMADALRALSGRSFDNQYMQGQVTAHQEAVALFEQASTATGADMADFRAFAAQTLPILRQHLAEAQSIVGSGVPTANQ